MENGVLPEERKRPVLELLPDVACLQLSMVNVYLYGERGAGDRGWVLVDAGLRTSAHAITREAAERFGAHARPAAIILTHGHFDHVGALRPLTERWDVPIYAHRLEMPYLTGQSDYPPPDPTVGGGAIAAVASRFFPRRGIELGERVQPLPADGSVPGMAGWRWVHTPGHTPGHVSVFRDADRVLIVGDAFVTTRQESLWAVATRRPEVWRPPAYFTMDWQAAWRSVELLAELEPTVAGAGHGIPMRGERMRQQLRALARDFARRAIPAHGRYVREPALADERGVVRVPPPVPDPLPLVLTGLGVAAVVGTAWVRGRGTPHEEAGRGA